MCIYVYMCVYVHYYICIFMCVYVHAGVVEYMFFPVRGSYIFYELAAQLRCVVNLILTYVSLIFLSAHSYYVHVLLHNNGKATSICMYLCTLYMYMCVCVYIHIYVFMCMYMYLYTSVCMDVCMHMYVY